MIEGDIERIHDIAMEHMRKVRAMTDPLEERDLDPEDRPVVNVDVEVEAEEPVAEPTDNAEEGHVEPEADDA